MKTRTLNQILVALCLTGAAGAALADRPLATDNAAINPRNGGDVELWVTRVDSENLTSLRGAYSFWDSVELGASVASGSGITITGLEGKWLITPTQQNGCNFAAALGWSRVKIDGFGSNNGTGVNGIMSCNGGLGRLHLNVGYSKPSGADGVTSWGIAFERPFGAVTPHIEVFGLEDGDPTVQVGLRGDIARNVQLDGTIGRVDSVNIYSVGLRFRF
jgi:hypothetical protein